MGVHHAKAANDVLGMSLETQFFVILAEEPQATDKAAFDGQISSRQVGVRRQSLFCVRVHLLLGKIAPNGYLYAYATPKPIGTGGAS